MLTVKIVLLYISHYFCVIYFYCFMLFSSQTIKTPTFDKFNEDTNKLVNNSKNYY